MYAWQWVHLVHNDMQAGVSGLISEYLREQLGNALHLPLQSTVSDPGGVL